MMRNDLVLCGVERVVEFAQENNGVIDFEIDEDLLATARFNGVTIESDDVLFDEMVSLLTGDVVDEIIDGAENVLLA